MEQTVFNPAQMKILQMMSYISISPLQRKVLTHEVFTFASEFFKIRIMETTVNT